MLKSAAQDLIADLEATLVLKPRPGEARGGVREEGLAGEGEDGGQRRKREGDDESNNDETLESEENGDSGDGGGGKSAVGEGGGGGASDVQGMGRVMEFFGGNEVFGDMVQRRCAEEAMDRLDARREQVVRVVEEHVLPLINAYNAATAAKADAAGGGGGTATSQGTCSLVV